MNFVCTCFKFGVHCSVVRRFPMGSMNIFNLPNPSSRTMLLGFILQQTEMNTRTVFRSKERSANKSGNITAISELIVYKY
jgi:hypothetical protein